MVIFNNFSYSKPGKYDLTYNSTNKFDEINVYNFSNTNFSNYSCIDFSSPHDFNDILSVDIYPRIKYKDINDSQLLLINSDNNSTLNLTINRIYKNNSTYTIKFNLKNQKLEQNTTYIFSLSLTNATISPKYTSEEVNLFNVSNISEFLNVSFNEFLTKRITKNYVNIRFNNLTNISYEYISNMRVLSDPQIDVYNCSFIETDKYNDTNGTYACNVSSSKTVYGIFAYEICGVSYNTIPIKIYETQKDEENIVFVKVNFWILISFITIIL